MRRSVLTFVSVFSLAAYFLPTGAWAEEAAKEFPDGSPLVNCYSARTDTVEPLFRNQCQGQVVSDDEAKVIRQKRIDRTRRALQAAASPVPADFKRKSAGTGFFVTETGLMLTNNHVIAECRALTAELSTGQELPAHVLAAVPADDLALLQVEGTAPAIVTFREHVAYDNQPITIIGYPNQGLQRIVPYLVNGSLSGPEIEAGRKFRFQADIRPGNSGSPVLDPQGLVVGVVFAKIDTATVYQKTGEHVALVGFGISMDAVRDLFARNGVAAHFADSSQNLAVGGVNGEAGPFMARVVCWM